jgi:hypothetical protein
MQAGQWGETDGSEQATAIHAQAIIRPPSAKVTAASYLTLRNNSVQGDELHTGERDYGLAEPPSAGPPAPAKCEVRRPKCVQN